jgi:large subunit ribosomal protein L17
MRHLSSKKKLGRSKAHREAVLANLAASLIIHKRIKTTHVKAQELRRFVEPLITFAKRGDLHARRMVLRKIRNKEVVHSLFHEIAPVYSDRNGGYTRITKLGFRDNDRAKVSQIELIDIAGISEAKTDKSQTKDKKSKKPAATSRGVEK